MKINSNLGIQSRKNLQKLGRVIKHKKSQEQKSNKNGKNRKVNENSKKQKKASLDRKRIKRQQEQVQEQLSDSEDQDQNQQVESANMIEAVTVQQGQPIGTARSQQVYKIQQQQKYGAQLHQQIQQEQSQQIQPEQELIPLNKNMEDTEKPSWYFSDKKFVDCSLSEPTLRALQKNNYHVMTHIQARTLPLLLKGKDVLGAAKTGSGKTLAYLIPCIEKLRQLDFRQKNGTGVIIITPTRQLAIQVFDVAKKMAQIHNKTVGLLIGGVNRKVESLRLQKGVNLLVCTPGRLLDHLQNSKFIYHNLFCLVIDEADALLRIGFEQQITDILKVLPKNRQTVLFSATQTRKIQDLAKLSLKNPIYIGVDDFNQTATVESLEQGFVVINADVKFRLLLTFLRKQKAKNKKVMVFFSSCNCVKFYSDLLNFIDIGVMDIHGKQKQQKRSTTFYQFNQMKQGILLCTDVAARGLDIPEVDWIVQYDPPLDIREYIHRVGRTCRGHNTRGKALLLLIEQERSYLQHLLQSKVQLNEYQFDLSKLQDIQEDFELLIQKNNYLRGEANQAFKSYLHAYTTYSLKDVFNVFKLDLLAVAKSFGLKRPPHVDLNVKLGGSKVKKIINGKKGNNNRY